MKKQELIYLAVALVLFAVAGVFLFNQSSAGKSANDEVVKVEIIDPIEPFYSQEALKTLTDPERVRDFTVPVTTQEGLGNSQLFKPF